MKLPAFHIFYIVLFLFMGCSTSFTTVEERTEEACVFPDYSGELIIPNNIAPMNFEILEYGKCFAVQILVRGKMEWQTLINSRSHSSQSTSINIPQKTWRNILNNSIGDTLQIHVFSGDSYDEMIAYKPFRWIVSEDCIDPFLVYRHIPKEGAETPPMGIYERNLETFDLRTLTETKLVDNACMNCHHFSANRSSRMCAHFRRSHPGTLITTPDSAFMVNMSLPNGEKGVFGDFSPNERFLAFSTNQLSNIHYSMIRRLKLWLYDTDAHIFVYDIQENAILSSDELTAENIQKTYPNWSHDGKYLYFCQSNQQAQPIGDTPALLKHIQNTHYALVRSHIHVDSVDKNTVTISPPEIVIDSQMVSGKSISFPTCSPDGHFIAFSTTEFGTHGPSSTDGRFWIYDIHSKATREVEPKLQNPIVSTSCWSSNSRWIVVATRRMDKGLFARPFLAHIDSSGNISKLFVVPIENPEDYRTQDYSYSMPELISYPVPMHAYDIAEAVRKPAKQPNYLYQFKNLKPIDPSVHKHTE